MASLGQKLTSDYVAGVVDSDGCIRWNNGTPEVSVVGVFAPLMAALESRFGGRALPHTIKEKAERPVWRWYVTGDNAMRCLEFIRSALKEKRAQADIVFALRQLSPGKLRDSLVKELSALKRTHYHLKSETNK